MRDSHADIRKWTEDMHGEREQVGETLQGCVSLKHLFILAVSNLQQVGGGYEHSE